MSEALTRVAEATMANANSSENVFGRWVAEFLTRFTPEEQRVVTSRIQRTMLDAEEFVLANRANRRDGDQP